MGEKIFLLILCHLLGDYVLQTRFIADSKGKNWYHMFIHCALYIFPFWFFFGWNWQLLVVFITHMIIDPMKARWGLIGYATDQIAHYSVLTLYLAGKGIWNVFVVIALAAGLVNLILDVFLNKEIHKGELRKYYESMDL